MTHSLQLVIVLMAKGFPPMIMIMTTNMHAVHKRMEDGCTTIAGASTSTPDTMKDMDLYTLQALGTAPGG